MKLFGHELFNWKKETDLKLYDFAQHGIIKYYDFFPVAELVRNVPPEEVAINTKKKKTPKKNKIDEPIKANITPKGLYMTKALNDNSFAIKTDPEYLEKQINDCKLKLDLMFSGKSNKKEKNELGMGAEKFGRLELESIIERLKNRLKLEEFKDIIDKYPHTTSELINKIIETHKEALRFKKAEEFIPDFPIEAVKAMAEYNKMCQGLCKKDTSFYVLAQKGDFETVRKRRDPILLAQSPFGFFWQILGAWDEEMIYLGDL